MSSRAHRHQERNRVDPRRSKRKNTATTAAPVRKAPPQPNHLIEGNGEEPDQTPPDQDPVTNTPLAGSNATTLDTAGEAAGAKTEVEAALTVLAEHRDSGADQHHHDRARLGKSAEDENIIGEPEVETVTIPTHSRDPDKSHTHELTTVARDQMQTEGGTEERLAQKPNNRRDERALRTPQARSKRH